MKSTSLLILLFTLSNIGILNAQDWTAEERSLFTHIETCWESRGLEDYSKSIDICNIAEDIVYWPSSEIAPPTGLEWHHNAKQAVFDSGELLDHEFTPLRVLNHGETYIVFYRGERRYRLNDGSILEARWRGIDIWVREDAEWKMVGGMDSDL